MLKSAHTVEVSRSTSVEIAAVRATSVPSERDPKARRRVCLTS
jgi:hypothetical protein